MIAVSPRWLLLFQTVASVFGLALTNFGSSHRSKKLQFPCIHFTVTANSGSSRQCPDFRVRVDPGVHKFRRCVYASVNGQIWKRWPKRLTVGALEWVCNWCFFRGAAGKFALHAATAEVPSGEGAIVFPGLSGAGKSTLAATLMLSGWRLLSDEVALFDLKDAQLTGLGRSTVLKGKSLQLIREGFPGKSYFRTNWPHA